jgi:mRNA-degrading endonuclease RelE of RelBE toxin-antitoxin system
MDKIRKFLIKLNKNQRQVFSKIFRDITTLNLAKYDVKALSGLEGVFRLRKGNIRIVFAKNKKVGVILDVAFRKDIYKK